MINHPTIFSLIFLSLSFTTDYYSLFHTLCTAVSLLSPSCSFSAFSPVCVWEEVMFENDNTGKLKIEGKEIRHSDVSQCCIPCVHYAIS